MDEPTTKPRTMGDYFAVFNSIAADTDKAKWAFKLQFGKDAYREQIKPYLKKGIMSIFKDDPNEYTLWYVRYLADVVRERLGYAKPGEDEEE